MSDSRKLAIFALTPPVAELLSGLVLVVFIPDFLEHSAELSYTIYCLLGEYVVFWFDFFWFFHVLSD